MRSFCIKRFSIASPRQSVGSIKSAGQHAATAAICTMEGKPRHGIVIIEFPEAGRDPLMHPVVGEMVRPYTDARNAAYVLVQMADGEIDKDVAIEFATFPDVFVAKPTFRSRCLLVRRYKEFWCLFKFGSNIDELIHVATFARKPQCFDRASDFPCHA